MIINVNDVSGLICKPCARIGPSGPLPPPSILQEYENINQNFPDKIMKMAEDEQSFRHDFINGKLIKDKSNDRLYLICNSILLFSAIVAIVFISKHSPLVAISLGAAISGMIMYGQITGNKKETVRKDEMHHDDIEKK